MSLDHRPTSMPARRILALAGLALALAACSSTPPPRYHTLLQPASSAAALTPTISWIIAGVSVPAQVDQPQWVVRLPDESLRLLEQERWVAPLADEMQGAFGDALARRLGAPGLPKPASGKSWRVRIDVQRLDSAPAQLAALVVDWSIASAGGTAAELRCRDAVRQPVGAGIPALAAAHRDAVVQIAQRIGAAVQALDGGTAAARCPTGA